MRHGAGLMAIRTRQGRQVVGWFWVRDLCTGPCMSVGADANPFSCLLLVLKVLGQSKLCLMREGHAARRHWGRGKTLVCLDCFEDVGLLTGHYLSAGTAARAANPRPLASESRGPVERVFGA